MARELTPEEHAAAIERLLLERASPERREHSAGYFQSSMTPLGVAVPDLRQVARRYARTLPDPASVLAVAKALIGRNTLEGRQAAYEMLAGSRSVAPLLDRPTLEDLAAGNDNWASVDALATGLIGPAWLQGRLQDADLLEWARHPDRWWRRTALAATVCLNLKSRGGSGDAPRTLEVCAAALEGDVDAMLAKALSWALRSAVPHDPEAVRWFLEQNEARIPRSVRREVDNKIRTGRKSG